MTLHEVLDDTVELGTFVAELKLPSGQGPEVFGGLWNGLLSQNDSQVPQECRDIQNSAYTTKEPNDN